MATPYVQLIIEIVIENDYPPMFLLNYFVSSYIQLLLEFIFSTDIQLFGFSIKSIFLSFHEIHEFYYPVMNTLNTLHEYILLKPKPIKIFTIQGNISQYFSFVLCKLNHVLFSIID